MHAAGLQKGDRIMIVDGTDISEMSRQDAAAALKAALDASSTRVLSLVVGRRCKIDQIPAEATLLPEEGEEDVDHQATSPPLPAAATSPLGAYSSQSTGAASKQGDALGTSGKKSGVFSWGKKPSDVTSTAAPVAATSSAPAATARSTVEQSSPALVGGSNKSATVSSEDFSLSSSPASPGQPTSGSLRERSPSTSSVTYAMPAFSPRVAAPATAQEAFERLMQDPSAVISLVSRTGLGCVVANNNF
jgi:hypothetical protein